MLVSSKSNCLRSSLGFACAADSETSYRIACSRFASWEYGTRGPCLTVAVGLLVAARPSSAPLSPTQSGRISGTALVIAAVDKMAVTETMQYAVTWMTFRRKIRPGNIIRKGMRTSILDGETLSEVHVHYSRNGRGFHLESSICGNLLPSER